MLGFERRSQVKALTARKTRSAGLIELSHGVRRLCRAAAVSSGIAAIQFGGAPAVLAQQVQVRPAAPHSIARVTLIQNKAKNIKVDVPFADSAIGSADIADIVPISDRQLYIIGKKIGSTNVLLYDGEKRLIGTIDVDVKLDTANLTEKLRSATGDPAVHVQDVEGKVVVSGNGRDAPTIERTMAIAGAAGGAPAINAMRLRGSQQVMLQVRFVEASRGAARAIGVRWQGIVNNRAAGVVGRAGNSSRLATDGLLAGESTRPFGPRVPDASQGGLLGSGVVLDALTGGLTRAAPVATILTQLVNTSSVGIDVVLSALEDNGVVRRLAEPNLVALSGESADFLAGGQFPVPVTQGGAGFGGVANTTVQWKDYGVRLSFQPTVLDQGVISLRLEPEVSDIDENLAVSLCQGCSPVPAVFTRRSRTTVELRDGQTFAISGLISSRSARQIDQVPWLGSVPVLGALFRSSEFAAQESELVCLVTPRIVKPVPPGNKDPRLKTPLDSSLAANDVDQFIGGLMELPKQPPVYVEPNGSAQPVTGAIAAGAPEVNGEPAQPANPFQNFFQGAFAAPAAAPQQ